MGVRGRLILVTTLVLGFTVLAAIALTIRLEDGEERRAEAERAEQLSIAFAAAIIDDLRAVPPGTGADQVRRFVGTLEREGATFGLKALYVLDNDGVDVAHSHSPPIDPFLQRILDNKDGGADPPPPAWPRRIATPIFVDGRRYVVVSVLDDAPLNARLVERTRRLAGTNLVLSLLGLLILLTVLSREVLAPLAQLAEMARKFGRGDLDPADGLAGGARELQQLSAALRDAAARTGARKQELEAEVERRTAELAGANAELSLMNARLQQLALTDPLTGLFNRRALEQALEHEVTRQKRGRRPFSLMMIDVDHFKNLNDTYGHAAGDVVLQGIARAIQQTLRASDIVARVGGEEFVVLLIDTELPHANTAADKVRLSVRAQNFRGGETQPQGRVTVSVGVACWPRHGDTAEAVLAAADKALYVAKGAGRDRVQAAVEEASSSEPRQPV